MNGKRESGKASTCERSRRGTCRKGRRLAAAQQLYVMPSCGGILRNSEHLLLVIALTRFVISSWKSGPDAPKLCAETSICLLPATTTSFLSAAVEFGSEAGGEHKDLSIYEKGSTQKSDYTCVLRLKDVQSGSAVEMVTL